MGIILFIIAFMSSTYCASILMNVEKKCKQDMILHQKKYIFMRIYTQKTKVISFGTFMLCFVMFLLSILLMTMLIIQWIR